MRTILFAFLMMTAEAASGLMVTVESNVVGYMSSEVKKGLNEVSVKMDSLGIFPTLDQVVKFSPPENVLGDILVYDLDGVRREYVFEGWSGSNYVLRAQNRRLPAEIGLDWIPLRRTFWVRHVTTNSLSIVNSGQAVLERGLKCRSSDNSVRSSIEVRVVDEKNEERGILCPKK